MTNEVRSTVPRTLMISAKQTFPSTIDRRISVVPPPGIIVVGGVPAHVVAVTLIDNGHCTEILLAETMLLLKMAGEGTLLADLCTIVVEAEEA
jgi:hypothetical protein